MKADGYNIRVSEFNDNFYNHYEDKVKETLDRFKMKHEKKRYQYYTRYGFAAMLLKKDYAKFAGNQD